MRTVLIAAAVLASAGAADAGQQRVMVPGPSSGPGTGAGVNGGAMVPRPAPVGVPRGPGDYSGGQHWGGRYQGHWVGGVRAPGGLGGYRRPYRGYVLPAYWVSPGFLIGDWNSYGLYQPPVGYSWSRYYDDAVLIDGRGSVYDTVGGIEWSRYDLDEAQGGRIDAYHANADGYRASMAGADYAYPPQTGYGEGGYGQGGPGRDGYAPQPGEVPPAPGGYGRPRSNGVGGALIGGAAGGIAGGLIAGRHDKVGGALIGAGAGALAGYAIDRSRRRTDAPGYGGPSYGGAGAGYPVPADGYSSGPGYAPPTVIESGRGTLVTTSSVGGAAGGTYVNGYYYPPATVTTVTVARAPVVTTTTEVFEDSVTYTRPAVHRVYRKRVWRPVPRCYCR